MNLDPRKSTLDILNQLDATNNTLDHAMDSVFKQYPEADRRDKAFLFALTYGVLRWRKRIDWVIAYFSKIKRNKIDPRVLNILRIGLFQIMFLDRVPVSAAVNTSVEMAKKVSAPWVVRYVNGVLRNASKGYPSVALPDSLKDPVKFLAVYHSFPEWLIRRWIKRWGPDKTTRLCAAFNETPALTLRTNILKTSRVRLINDLSPVCSAIFPAEYAPEGILITNIQTSVSDIKPFVKGYFSVQDEAAQAVSRLLNPEPGQTVLDACCGLGGKTGHLAQVMKNTGRIIAMDKNAKKLSLLEEEMQRLGINIVAPEKHDLSHKNTKPNWPVFDKILLDAPCSGLGVIRRNPDTKWRAKPENLPQLSKTQQSLLKQCADLCKPGGTMVYAVCSMEPEENEKVIQSFLKEHTNFYIEKPDTAFPAWLKTLMDEDGFLRTLPHIHRMDGFFAVRLKKHVRG